MELKVIQLYCVSYSSTLAVIAAPTLAPAPTTIVSLTIMIYKR